MAIIHGRLIARQAQKELKTRLQAEGLKLNLAAVTIGENPALRKFVELKKKAAQEVGITLTSHVLPQDVSQEDACAFVAQLSANPAIQGIFIELPVPLHLDVQALLNEIVVNKDVDVLSQTQENQFYSGRSILLPPAVLALKMALEHEHVSWKGKKVAVFGQGRLIGMPISYWFKSQGVEVFRIDEYTSPPENYSRQADIIVSGVGKPGLVTSDLVQEGAVVIDFGYGRNGEAMVGDVAFPEVSQKASLITPVPGGMGPLVVVAVLKNLLELSLIKNSDSQDSIQ